MSELTASLPPQLPPHPAARLRDFPDLLSPILVKELRQGMRTYFFSLTFILLQAVMLFTVFVGATNPSGTSQTVTGIFWFFAYATLGVALPLRGFSSLSSEIKGDTMELIRMTRMGSWGLTFGKWAALTSQMLLFAIGLLPYILIRYYLGGVEVIDELKLFGILVFQSAVTTAFVVGMSTFRSVLLRLGIMVGLPFAIYMVMMVVAVSRMASAFATPGSTTTTTGISFSPDDLADWRLLLASGAFSIYFFLDFGASRLAAEAVNFATRKRLMTLAYIGLMLLLPLTGVPAGACLFYALLGMVYASLDCLTEAPVITSEIMRPFHGMRRPAAFLLAPGWHTGIFFVPLVAGLMALFKITQFASVTMTEQAWTFCFAFLGTITLPSLIIHLFFHQRSCLTGHFGTYVLIQIALFALTLLAFIFASTLGQTEKALLFLPLPSVILAGFVEDAARATPLLPVVMAQVGLAVLVPALRAVPLYRAMNRAVRGAETGDPQSDLMAPHIGDVNL